MTMKRAIALMCAVTGLIAAEPAMAQFLPPPGLENRIPAPLPDPPAPPVVNGPYLQAPSPGVYSPPRLSTQGDRAVRCFHQGGSNGLRGGELDAYTRECADGN
jgi:hypothetical protein